MITEGISSKKIQHYGQMNLRKCVNWVNFGNEKDERERCCKRPKGKMQNKNFKNQFGYLGWTNCATMNIGVHRFF